MIEFIDECPSTHIYLIEAVKNRAVTTPHAVCARVQSAGVGSRGNEWVGIKGNLFLSFCIDKKELPNDLNEASISIYFAMIMKEFLKQKGSNLWVKWPNDFYINNAKIGGTISTKVGEIYIGSIGLNLAHAPLNYGILDIQISVDSVVWGFCKKLEEKKSWKQIFSKFNVEFAKSKKFITHIGETSVDLSDATLCDDGAIFINNKKVYSLR